MSHSVFIIKHTLLVCCLIKAFLNGKGGSEMAISEDRYCLLTIPGQFMRHEDTFSSPNDK